MAKEQQPKQSVIKKYLVHTHFLCPLIVRLLSFILYPFTHLR